MNNLLRKILASLKGSWQKWSMLQRLLVLGIVVVALLALVLIFALSARPASDSNLLLRSPIQDADQLNRVLLRLDAEEIGYRLGSDNLIRLDDSRQVRRARSLLIREDLLPTDTDPWAIFDVSSWTVTEFEQDVKLRRAVTRELEQHISALNDVDSASVTLVMPKKRLLSSLQEPTTASVVLTPHPGSDISINQKKLQGIVKLIQFAVPGLSADNITLLDYSGKLLNDFDNLASFDRLDLGRKIIKERQLLEAQLARSIHSSLSRIMTEDRVDIINVAIDLEYVDKKVRLEEKQPIYKKRDNPNTSWDDTEIFEAAPLSSMEETTDFEGSNFNPEGPAGQEGQLPSQYKDLLQSPGKYHSASRVNNYQWSQAITDQIAEPLDISRIAVGVALDGVWRKEQDKNGDVVLEAGKIKRVYQPISAEELEKVRTLLRAAIGIDELRGDQLSVENIQFDRSREFSEEDEQYMQQRKLVLSLLYSLLAVMSLIMMVLLFRLWLRYRERKRRQHEEELARKHQAMREAALREAEDDVMGGGSLSGRDRGRMELQELAVNAVRDNPEGVAQMVRMWLQQED